MATFVYNVNTDLPGMETTQFLTNEDATAFAEMFDTADTENKHSCVIEVLQVSTEDV